MLVPMRVGSLLGQLKQLYSVADSTETGGPFYRRMKIAGCWSCSHASRRRLAGCSTLWDFLGHLMVIFRSPNIYTYSEVMYTKTRFFNCPGRSLKAGEVPQVQVLSVHVLTVGQEGTKGVRNSKSIGSLVGRPMVVVFSPQNACKILGLGILTHMIHAWYIYIYILLVGSVW